MTITTAPADKPARKRTRRATEPEAPASTLPAQPEPPPVPGAALSAAESRRAGAVDRLRRDLDALERSWQATISGLMVAGASAAIREQQQNQYEDGKAATLGKLADAEALTGWPLVERFAAEFGPPEPQPDPDAWKVGLHRGTMLPRQQVGAAPEAADPGYLRQYEARRADWQAEDERQQRIKRGQEALALAALGPQEN